MKQLNFKDEGLKVDWIGLNCEKLEESNLKKVVEFLSEFGFNVTLKEKKDQEWETRKLITHPHNRHTVEFQQHYYEPEKKKFWAGTKINFTGENANHFYLQTHIQKTRFWNMLSSITNFNLARLDICFDRPNKENENNETFRKFIESCQSDLLDKYKRGVIKLKRDKQGFILTIGSRQSTKYFRVYQKKTGTRFELEIKNKSQYLKSIQNLFFQNFTSTFEERITNYFYSHSKKVLNLTFPYTDWLVKSFQKQRYIRTSSSFLTSYFEANHTLSSNIKELEQLYRFLQFLSFSQTHPSKSIEIASHKYQIINFEIQDFMEFINVKNASEYKTKQLIDFFQELTNTPHLVNIFSEHQFQILATFPFVHVDDDSGVWKAEIYFNHQLYSYQYPFLFPKSYSSYQDKYDMQIKLQIMQSFANTSLKKKFNISEFLGRFQNTPNQTKAYIKNRIISTFQELLYHKLIQTNIALHVLGNKRENESRLQKTLHIELKQLTSLLIGKATTLHYFEII